MIKKYWGYVLMLVILIGLFVLVWCVEPPFSSGKTESHVLTITQGENIQQVAMVLQNDRIISSEFFLRGVLKISGGGREVTAGEYLFDQPESVFMVAYRLSHGDFGISQSQFIVPEGSDVADIAAILKQKYPTFYTAEFISLAAPKEGYLFPDTYTLPAGATSSEVILLMSTNFETKLAPLMTQIKASGHSLNDIITMASILEAEAQTDTDRKIVAGILWKRIVTGVRLQVDSTLRYETGKTSAELTSADLSSDSAYNTYTHYGLPPGPINNPGLESIEAALNPIQTSYVYFLSDSNGTLHYATTLEEHDSNKKKYL